MNTLTDKMNSQQAADYLLEFDAQLIKVGAEAVREVGSIKLMSEAHEKALRTFAADGITNPLAAINATSFLRGLDDLIFGPGYRPSGATSPNERSNYFVQLADKQTAAAQAAHFQSARVRLAMALESIIAAKSKGRDASREKLANEIEKLERRERLETSMEEHPARVLRARIDTLEGKLVASDATHREAVRLTAKLRTSSATINDLNDARGFASQISYDE